LAGLERALERAQEHFSAERYSEALKEFTKASELVPTDPRPYDGLGNVYRNLILEEKAEEAFRKALKLDPEYQPSKKSLCMLLYEFGKNEDAVTLLKDAQKKNPNDSFLWGELALNAIRLGRPEEAISLLEKYNQANGRQAWGYTNLARAHAEAGHAVEAEKAYREALAIDPKMASACLWLGQLLISVGRKAEAEPLLKTFQRLRDLQTQEHNLKMTLLRAPGHVPTLVELARVRYLLGKHREAVAAFERAIQLTPDDAKLRHLYQEMVRSLEKASGK
jgi:Flp pilus assembly protein TadD